MSIRRLVAVVAVNVLLGCPPPSPSSGDKPAGTPTDPVQVCEQVGDVCQEAGGSQLGVCNRTTENCPGPEPCFVCMPQH